MSTPLRLGTRGSALALWQANHVADLLRRHDEGLDVEVVVIKTTGDVRQDVALKEMAGKGVFVREIETSLLRGDLDLAVHSAKDLPSVDTLGTQLAAFCERADPRDALISRTGDTLGNLSFGALVATSAPRRIAQLKHLRPDLRFTEIRGNVDTRLRKLELGEADALILACAGLDRLGHADVITERIALDLSLPQVGQASVAVQTRSDDEAVTTRIQSACDHADTRACVATERAFLSRLGGGCTAPVAAHARLDREETPTLWLVARVLSPDGTRMLQAVGGGSPNTGVQIAELVYQELLEQGARELLDAAP